MAVAGALNGNIAQDAIGGVEIALGQMPKAAKLA